MPVKLAVYFAISAFVALALSPEAPTTTGQSSSHLRVDAITLPVRYVTDRFYVVPVTMEGDTLILYTDTGGGANMMYSASVDRLGLEPQLLVIGEDSARVVSLPAMKHDAAIPPPNLLPPFADRMLITQPEPGSSFDGTGFLGRTWFAGRVWEFDYAKESLGLVTGYNSRAASAEHRVELGFQTDSRGRRTTHFPRIQAAVDGETLDLLFDTGATVRLTDGALAQLDDGGPVERGTSFITEWVFTRWRERHPTWRVIEHADETLDMPMIEVPALTVAGHTVGPVWFTMRPDRNFHEYMSRWMDHRIEGALGGSALRYFRVIVDYPNAMAVFERP